MPHPNASGRAIAPYRGALVFEDFCIRMHAHHEHVAERLGLTQGVVVACATKVREERKTEQESER